MSGKKTGPPGVNPGAACPLSDRAARIDGGGAHACHSRRARFRVRFSRPAPCSTPAKADPYKWCAEYGSEGMGGSQNCYFMTEAQCRAQVSGIGGFCKPNPWYDGRPVGETPAGSPPRRKKRS